MPSGRRACTWCRCSQRTAFCWSTEKATSKPSDHCRDSVIGSILVDSVVRDSIFGEYLIPFWRMGVRQGIRVPNFYQVRVVHGAFRGDSFGLILDPRVIDGRLHMAGRVQHRSGRGVWHVDPDYPRGTFTILPARVP